MRTILSIALLLLFLGACGGNKTVAADEKFDPESALKKSNQLIESKNFEDARRLLDDIRIKDSTGLYAPTAQLRSADAYIAEKEPELAIEEYRRFIQLYPGHKYAAYAQYQIGMIYFNMIRDPERSNWSAEKSLVEFAVLNTKYPRHPYRDVIEANIEECREIIAGNEYMVGEFYYKKEAYDGALGRFVGLLGRFPGSKREPEALLKIALSYKALGKNDEADIYFKMLVSRYPGTPSAKEAQKRFTPIPASK